MSISVTVNGDFNFMVGLSEMMEDDMLLEEFFDDLLQELAQRGKLKKSGEADKVGRKAPRERILFSELEDEDGSLFDADEGLEAQRAFDCKRYSKRV